jgi:hypothetical protein
MSDDHSPGDRRQPYSDRGGPEARHAETHDVRRERHTNPKGPETVDPTFAEDLAPVDVSGGHADDSDRAASDKVVHTMLAGFTNDELARFAILEPGTRLEQGGTYVNLNDLESGPFKAIGGQEAGPKDRIVAKRDTDYELWNRLVGEDRTPEIERPETEEHPA